MYANDSIALKGLVEYIKSSSVIQLFRLRHFDTSEFLLLKYIGQSKAPLVVVPRA